MGGPDRRKKATNSSDSLSGTPPFNISGTQYDIARAKWGEKWRLPTQQELKNYLINVYGNGLNTKKLQAIW